MDEYIYCHGKNAGEANSDQEGGFGKRPTLCDPESLYVDRNLSGGSRYAFLYVHEKDGNRFCLTRCGYDADGHIFRYSLSGLEKDLKDLPESDLIADCLLGVKWPTSRKELDDLTGDDHDDPVSFQQLRYKKPKGDGSVERKHLLAADCIAGGKTAFLWAPTPDTAAKLAASVLRCLPAGFANTVSFIVFPDNDFRALLELTARLKLGLVILSRRPEASEREELKKADKMRYFDEDAEAGKCSTAFGQHCDALLSSQKGAPAMLQFVRDFGDTIFGSGRRNADVFSDRNAVRIVELARGGSVKPGEKIEMRAGAGFRDEFTRRFLPDEDIIKECSEVFGSGEVPDPFAEPFMQFLAYLHGSTRPEDGVHRADLVGMWKGYLLEKLRNGVVSGKLCDPALLREYGVFDEIGEADINRLVSKYSEPAADAGWNIDTMRLLVQLVRFYRGRADSAKAELASEAARVYCSVSRTKTQDVSFDPSDYGLTDPKELYALLLDSVFDLSVFDRKDAKADEKTAEEETARKERFKKYRSVAEKILEPSDPNRKGETRKTGKGLRKAVDTWLAICEKCAKRMGKKAFQRGLETLRSDSDPLIALEAIGVSQPPFLPLDGLTELFRDEALCGNLKEGGSGKLQSQDKALFEALRNYYTDEIPLGDQVNEENFETYRQTVALIREPDTATPDADKKCKQAEDYLAWKNVTKDDRAAFLNGAYLVLPKKERRETAIMCLKAVEFKKSEPTKELTEEMYIPSLAGDRPMPAQVLVNKLMAGNERGKTGEGGAVSEGRAWEIFSEMLRKKRYGYRSPERKGGSPKFFRRWKKKDFLRCAAGTAFFTLISLVLLFLLPAVRFFTVGGGVLGMTFPETLREMVHPAYLLFPFAAFAVYLGTSLWRLHGKETAKGGGKQLLRAEGRNALWIVVVPEAIFFFVLLLCFYFSV